MKNMKNKISSIILGTLLFTNTSFAQSSNRILPFTDVGFAHPNHNAIKFLYEQEIINGYPDNTFQPEKTINRAEALKIIFLSAGVTPKATDRLSYVDVDISAWYIPYLREALNKQIATGYPDGSFKPGNNIKLVEALKMLLETHNVDLESVDPNDPLFLDAFATEWYATYLKFAKENDLLTVTNNKVFPSKDLTRAEFAEIVYRLIRPDIQPIPTIPPTNQTPNQPSTPTSPSTPQTEGYESFATFESTNGKFKVLYPKNLYYGATTYENQTVPKARLIYEFSTTSLEEKPNPESTYKANARMHIYSKDESKILISDYLANTTKTRNNSLDETGKTVTVYKLETPTDWPESKQVFYRELSDGRIVIIELINLTENEGIKMISSFKTLN